MSVPRNGFTRSLGDLYNWLDTLSVNVYSTIPVNTTHTVDSNQQMMVCDTLTVDGQLLVNGEARVVAWPT